MPKSSRLFGNSPWPQIYDGVGVGGAFMGEGDTPVVPYSDTFLEGSEFQESHTILTNSIQQYGVSAITFDTHEELCWIGNQEGYVMSYYGAGMQKYTSFKVHESEEVRCIQTLENCILALTPSSIRSQSRRGVPVLFTHMSENMSEMQCMLQLQSSPDCVLLGGHQPNLIQFNVERQQELNLIQAGSDSGCAILRQGNNRFVCCGDPSGLVTLRDPVTLNVEHSIETHTASLSDFDVHGNLLVSCGFSTNRQGNIEVDRLLMVFDVRMMRAVSPIDVLLEPFMLRFMPSMSPRVAVASSLGQLQFVDTVTLTEPNLSLYQINASNAMTLSLDVSSTCQAVAVGDSASTLHLFTPTDGSDVVFNGFSRVTDFPDPVDMSITPIAISDELAVYSSIPLTYPLPTGVKLSSDWPTQFLKKVYRETPPIDPEILNTIKMQGTTGYALNPNTKRRNQCPYVIDLKPNLNKNKDKPNEDNGVALSLNDGVVVSIPKRYRKIELKFSKLGSEDFDFEQYNKTIFSGLEATLPNTYCNAMIQVLFFIEPLRKAICSHLCSQEFCLCCELSFLFHMLHKSKSLPCHSGNFLRALRNAPEAAGLDLNIAEQISAEIHKKLISTVQKWNRFILHRIHNELLESKKRAANELDKKGQENEVFTKEKEVRNQSKRKGKTKDEDDKAVTTKSKDEDSEVSRLFGSKHLHTSRCLKCSQEEVKESSPLVCNLMYPEYVEEDKEVSFCDVLSQSLCPEQTVPSWCEQCERFQPTTQSRRLKSLPQVLTINCCLENEKDLNFWQNQMNILVRKAMEKAPNDPLINHPMPLHSHKPCRYGINCTRPDCRFKHPGQSPGESVPRETNSAHHFYYTHSWLPLHMTIGLSDGGQVVISKVDKTLVDMVATQIKEENSAEKKLYDLSAVVCYVHDEKKNLVSLVNVPASYHKNTSQPNAPLWFIFNDFSISQVTGQEAIWFSLDWKIPCVLYFTEHSIMSSSVTNEFQPEPISLNVFSEDVSLAANSQGRKAIAFTPLSPDEAPQPGEIVAMDAEFVSLNQEESEIRSDGKMTSVKPSHYSVARITCLRGQGPLEGTPFIDDYISTQEQVVDYLTKFSGIKPGDLDIAISSKHLTTLKSTYLKLRCLIDNGVKFVGHGLSNDFRVINLMVPPDQVIDTVQLFYLPGQRMVSLRFLTWHYLGMKIQSQTHDSIEDAKSALELYKVYLKLNKEGTFQSSLEELYEIGKSCQWKVPGEE